MPGSIFFNLPAPDTSTIVELHVALGHGDAHSSVTVSTALEMRLFATFSASESLNVFMMFSLPRAALFASSHISLGRCNRVFVSLALRFSSSIQDTSQFRHSALLCSAKGVRGPIESLWRNKITLRHLERLLTKAPASQRADFFLCLWLPKPGTAHSYSQCLPSYRAPSGPRSADSLSRRGCSDRHWRNL